MGFIPKQNPKVEQTIGEDKSLPEISTNLATKSDLPKTTSKFSLNSGEPISINTDLLSLSINTAGGDIRELNIQST